MSTKPRRGQPRRRLLRRGEVNGPAHVAEGRGGRRRRSPPARWAMFPGAAALGDELAARPQRGVQAREQPLVVFDPVEGRIESRIASNGWRDFRARPGRRRTPRPGYRAARMLLVDHHLAAVDRDQRAVRDPREQLLGDAAGAAARVEHALVPAEVEPVHDVPRHRGLRVGHPVVGGGIPFARRHTSVRYRIRSCPSVTITPGVVRLGSRASGRRAVDHASASGASVAPGHRREPVGRSV